MKITLKEGIVSKYTFFYTSELAGFEGYVNMNFCLITYYVKAISAK
jgi:hypothetical protein